MKTLLALSLLLFFGCTPYAERETARMVFLNHDVDGGPDRFVVIHPQSLGNRQYVCYGAGEGVCSTASLARRSKLVGGVWKRRPQGFVCGTGLTASSTLEAPDTLEVEFGSFLKGSIDDGHWRLELTFRGADPSISDTTLMCEFDWPIVQRQWWR